MLNNNILYVVQNYKIINEINQKITKSNFSSNG